MANCAGSESKKRKVKRGKKSMPQPDVRSVSCELDRLRKQQRTMQRNFKRIQEQQRRLQQKSQDLSTEVKRLREKVHQCTVDMEKMHQTHSNFGQQAGEILRDGMKHWMNGVMR